MSRQSCLYILTIEDVRKRFEELLKKKVGNQPSGRVRVMLEPKK